MKTVIIGGGACGLLSGILLAKRGERVTIVEKNQNPAKKIIVSGNGRCNITNKNISISNYPLGDRTLLKSLLGRFGFSEAKKLFSSLGIELVVDKDGRVFPLSFSGKSVVEVFLGHLKSLNVELLLNSEVFDVKKDEKSFLVELKDKKLRANKLIICSGSTAYKSVGVSDIGYRIAKKFGHSVKDLYPSLVQVECKDRVVYKASGVKIYSKVLVLDDKRVLYECEGDLLFTNYGLSGLAILDSSFYIYQAKEPYLMIDLMPKISYEELVALFDRRLKLKEILDFDSWLGAIIPKKLIPLVSKSNLLNKKSIKELAYNIKNLKIKVDSLRDEKYAEIIAGGVSSKEIDPKTLESKKIKNLYFGGEVLDVAGKRGGYNLHFAFASAYSLATSPSPFA